MAIQWEQSSHVPPRACTLVASVSPIPVQCVLKHCGVHKHTYYTLYIYTHTMIQNNLRTPQSLRTILGHQHWAVWWFNYQCYFSCDHKIVIKTFILYTKLQ